MSPFYIISAEQAKYELFLCLKIYQLCIIIYNICQYNKQRCKSMYSGGIKMKLKRLFVLSILSAFLMTSTAFATSSMPVDIGGAKIGSTISVAGYHVLTSGGVDVGLGKTAGANIPLIAPENKAAITAKYSKQNWSFGNYNQHKARIDADDMSEDAGATAVGGNILVYGVPFDLDTDGDPGSVF